MPFTPRFEAIMIPLPHPLPVVDIFHHQRLLLINRLLFQAYYHSVWGYSLRASINLTLVVIYGICRVNWDSDKILKQIMKIFLRQDRDRLVYIWWTAYFILAHRRNFEQNYVQAWSQRSTQSTHLFVDDDYLRIPLPDGDDAETLKHLRMYYRLICSRKSPAILLKQVERIDRVTVINGTLGRKIETIDLGRSDGRLVAFLEAPAKLEGQYAITQTLKDKAEIEGIEFVQLWDNVKISIAVMSPLFTSLVFVITWVSVFVRRGNDLQVTVQTAFTVASFMVTAGALVIALIAYLEQTKRTVI